MRTSAGRVAAICVVLLGLTACGDQGSSSTATDPPSTGSPSTASSSTPAAAREGCPYLTQDEVSGAVGAQTIETAGTVHACFFDPVANGGPSVMLSRVDVQIDPTDYAIQTRALCKGDITDVDAGDQAFACVMALGPQGQLYEGRVLITVNVNGAADDSAGIEAAADLIREVTIPPAA